VQQVNPVRQSLIHAKALIEEETELVAGAIAAHRRRRVPSLVRVAASEP